MSGPKLPPETLLELPNHVDEETLKALSLTSRLFVDDCRDKLFESFHVCITQEPLKAAVEVLSKPHIAQRVRHLTLEGVLVELDGGFRNWRRGVLDQIPQPPPRVYSQAAIEMSMQLARLMSLVSNHITSITLLCNFNTPGTRDWLYDGMAFFGMMKSVFETTRFPCLERLHIDCRNLEPVGQLSDPYFPENSDIFKANILNIRNVTINYQYGEFYSSLTPIRCFSHEGLKEFRLTSRQWYWQVGVAIENTGFANLSGLTSLTIEKTMFSGRFSTALAQMTNLTNIKIRQCCVNEGEDSWERVFVVCTDHMDKLQNLRLHCLHYMHWNQNGCASLAASPLSDIKAFSSLRQLCELKGQCGLEESCLSLSSCPEDHDALQWKEGQQVD